jgi:hypothetical protein
MERRLRVSAAECVDGIRLVNLTLNDEYDADFLEITRDALALIRRTDSRRYGILLREIRYIVNTDLLASAFAFASYNWCLRLCKVDFKRFELRKDGPHYEWRLARYAITLVHEATHARLASLYIPYNRATQMRVERICYEEERRFASRIESDTYDFSTVLPPFDEAKWEAHVTRGVVRRLKALLRRGSEANRRAKRSHSDSRR